MTTAKASAVKYSGEREPTCISNAELENSKGMEAVQDNCSSTSTHSRSLRSMGLRSIDPLFRSTWSVNTGPAAATSLIAVLLTAPESVWAVVRTFRLSRLPWRPSSAPMAARSQPRQPTHRVEGSAVRLISGSGSSDWGLGRSSLLLGKTDAKRSCSRKAPARNRPAGAQALPRMVFDDPARQVGRQCGNHRPACCPSWRCPRSRAEIERPLGRVDGGAAAGDRSA